jgi:serine/threonine protein kinase
MSKGTFICIHCGKPHLRFLEKCPETRETLSPVHKMEGLLLEGRYRLKGIVGEGGMGIVYEGLHEKLGSRIAVKFLRTEMKFSEETLKRFENEAKIAASLGHKNIVRILDMGVFESIPYFVMEFLEGEPLDEIIEAKGTLSMSEAVDIAIQVLEALNAVHFKGIIHRDLKPENIIITPQPGGGEVVKILDFGICRLQSDACSAMRVTKTGAVFGTPYYMPPEQAEGRRDIDSRADLYSVGAILYKMLTGRTPFTGENYNTVIVNIINKDPPPPRKWNMEIPMDLDSAIVKALSRKRDSRYLDAKEFIEALEPFSSVPLMRERRSSALSEPEEKKEPVPADIWSEEFSVIVHEEASLPTIPVELKPPEQAGRTAEPEETKARHERRKRTFSWDSTVGRLKGAGRKREAVWLLPAGIGLSVAAIAVVAWAIFTLMSTSRVTVGLKTHHAAAGLVAAAKGSGARAAGARDVMIMKVEESSIRMVEVPMVLLSFSGLPAGARVFIDGNESEQVPVPVQPRAEPFHVEVRAAGYISFTQDVRVRGDVVLQVNMQAEHRKTKKKMDITSPPIDTKYPGKKKK